MDQLHGVRLKLERAAFHIEAVKHEVRVYLGQKPHDVIFQPDSEPDHYVVRACVKFPPPPTVSLIAGDAVHNLRVALDMLAWELSQLGPSRIPELRIAADRKCDTCVVNRWRLRPKLRNLPQSACQLIESFQPYKRRRQPWNELAILQALDNRDKHKTLLITGALTMIGLRLNHPWQVVPGSQQPGPFNDDDEMVRVFNSDPVSNPYDYVEPQIQSTVGFSTDGPGRGAPLGFLQVIHDYIRDDVIPAFREFFSFRDAPSSPSRSD